jgi:Protein kinase domain/Ankyrin repeats (many copies)
MEGTKLYPENSDRISTNSGIKGSEEEPTNVSKLDCMTQEDNEDLVDSFFGSMSEGENEILTQKIPQMTCKQNFHYSQSSSLLNPVLLSLIEENNVQELLNTIQSHPDLHFNFKDDQGNSFLHIAVYKGYLGVCKVLLDYLDHSDINTPNFKLYQPLHVASELGFIEIAQLLVRSGANINSINLNGDTPLHLACKNKHAQLVSWLLSRNPNVLLVNSQGKTPENLGSQEISNLFKRYFRKTTVSKGPSLSESHKLTVLRAKATNQSISALSFEILKQLGKGSFGEVFLVRKINTSSVYAMKVLKKEKIITQNLISYALTERNVLSVMDHPFIVSLHWAFQTPDNLFLILDYCPGGDLSMRLLAQKTFSESVARIYIAEITLALEELHNHNIIYRDLKPDNVVLDADGHAVLTDFGLSKIGVHSNNKAKSFCGSIAYLAPEVLKRNGHGKTVDWYMLGVVFYEMVVGLPPYFSLNKNQLIDNIQKGKLKIPSSLSIEAKELIKDVIFT